MGNPRSIEGLNSPGALCINRCVGFDIGHGPETAPGHHEYLLMARGSEVGWGEPLGLFDTEEAALQSDPRAITYGSAQLCPACKGAYKLALSNLNSGR